MAAGEKQAAVEHPALAERVALGRAAREEVPRGAHDKWSPMTFHPAGVMCQLRLDDGMTFMNRLPNQSIGGH